MFHKCDSLSSHGLLYCRTDFLDLVMFITWKHEEMNMFRHKDKRPKREVQVMPSSIDAFGDPPTNSVSDQETVTKVTGEGQQVGVARYVVILPSSNSSPPFHHEFLHNEYGFTLIRHRLYMRFLEAKDGKAIDVLQVRHADVIC